MLPHTHPKDYYDTAVLDWEKAYLLHQTWQFVGLKQDLSVHNDFVTTQIGDVALVIQNFKGSLKAFRNVCSHRYSQLQSEAQGNRPLQCPYHGWVYNEKGIPAGIPHRKDFPCLEPEALALENFALETCGHLVFVRLSPNGSTLQAYLGDFFPMLEEMSHAFGPCLDTYTLTAPANWKVLVENSLEGYHVPFIHKNSIAQLGAGQVMQADSNEATAPKKQIGHAFHFAYPHSFVLDEVEEGAYSRWQKLERFFMSRPYQTKTYQQTHIFPNFNLATFYGSAFFIQTFHPVSATETRIVHRSIQTRLDSPSSQELAMVKVATDQMIQMGKVVLDEDVAISAKVQQGVEQIDRSGILCMEEKRVQEYQRAYRACRDGLFLEITGESAHCSSNLVSV
ncbi:MAG: aromatic ring-hydroxylating dioxygenase subunit alpha [Vampirovibrionales bacterium]|nr:aromatic ring-hydroxylating dioxygenase subunit alpha [Vampirovibrionales bacterium]